eukprot:c19616_g1_i2.p1 GENE.c19616_g1_i2~~c19616_g1_i2.p1  ORF type:complete len:862 (+),score=150.47 c19616_g1_i2:1-2586(+)
MGEWVMDLSAIKAGFDAIAQDGRCTIDAAASQFGIQDPTNETGTLDFADFVKLVWPPLTLKLDNGLVPVAEIPNLNRIHSEFNAMDVDHSGTISADEMRRSIRALCDGKNVPPQFVEEMIAEFDKNHDGLVSFEEYVLVVARATCPPKPTLNNIRKYFDLLSRRKAHLDGVELNQLSAMFNLPPPNKSKASKTSFSDAVKIIAPDLHTPVLARVYDVFREIDKDESGEVTLDELARSLKVLCNGKAIPRSFVESTLAEMDQDKDGSISFEEYLQVALQAASSTKKPRESVRVLRSNSRTTNAPRLNRRSSSGSQTKPGFEVAVPEALPEVELTKPTLNIIKSKFDKLAIDYVIPDTDLAKICGEFLVGFDLPKDRIRFSGCVNELAPELLIPDLDRIAATFDAIDSDKSGEISAEEMGKSLSGLCSGKKVPMSFIEATLGEFDKDRSGSVSFQEYVQVVIASQDRPLAETVTLNRIQQEFRELADNGILDGPGIQNFCSRLGVPVPEGTSKLDFAAIVQHVDPNLYDPMLTNFYEAFAEMDKDRSGEISEIEMKRSLKALCGGKEIPSSFVSSTLASFDRNADGSISFEEYVAVAQANQRSHPRKSVSRTKMAESSGRPSIRKSITRKNSAPTMKSTSSPSPGKIGASKQRPALLILDKIKRHFDQIVELGETDRKGLLMVAAACGMSGPIHFSKIVRLVAPDLLIPELDKVHEVFSLLDVNQDGHVSLDEMYTSLKALCSGKEVPRAFVEQTISTFDHNNDNRVSFEEYVAVVSQSQQLVTNQADGPVSTNLNSLKKVFERHAPGKLIPRSGVILACSELRLNPPQMTLSNYFFGDFVKAVAPHFYVSFSEKKIMVSDLP